MKISEVHFYHGWGFNADLWKTWIRETSFSRYHLFDRGYTGNPHKSQDFRIDSEFRMLISHSFGLHFIPEDMIRNATQVVIIGGFEQFHPESDKVSRRKMTRMLSRFSEMPLSVMADFYTNCMHPDERLVGSPGKLDLDLLGEDLRLLDECQLSTLDVLRGKPVLMFHGRDDIIVPAAQSVLLHALLPGSKLIEFSRAGHMIPVTHTGLILRNMMGLLDYGISESVDL